MEKLPALAGCLRRMTICSYNIKLSPYLSQGNLQFLQSRDAGHSHWANIRHIKGAKDKIKDSISNQVSAMIRIALRENGGANVKLNNKLAKAVQFAEKNNLPSKAIQTMIDKAMSSKNSLTPTKFEVKGPNGSLLIFDLSTRNTRKTNNDVGRMLAKRSGGALSLATAGITRNYFNNKGIIRASSRDSNQLSLEEVEDIAISVDAEDVKLVEEDGDVSYEICCDADSIYSVVKGLSETELGVTDHDVMPVPIDLVELSEDEKTAVDAAIEGVKSLLDITVEHVYDNIKW